MAPLGWRRSRRRSCEPFDPCQRSRRRSRTLLGKDVRMFTPLSESNPSQSLPSSSSSLASKDLLPAILELLRSEDLACSECVCRLWRAVASHREMPERAFSAPWMVHRVLGEPCSSVFWRQPSVDAFAISHRLRRGDTVAGLAIRYSVQVMGIKRLDNMMSDHGIYSRETADPYWQTRASSQQHLLY